MTNTLRHTVSTQDAGFIGEWVEMAAFRWFTDAKHYAIRSSSADKLGRIWVIENQNRPTFFQYGVEIDGPEIEIVIEVPVTIPLDPRALPIIEA